MSRAAAPSRQPSSSRGGWLAHQERGSPAALRGSEADPTGFHLDAAQHAWQNDACSSGLATLSCGDTHAQSRGQGPGALVRDVFSRGMAGVQEWPPGLDHRRPFFDENSRQGGYLQLSIPVPQMRSGLPRYVPTSAHDWGQVLMFRIWLTFGDSGIAEL
jgi:hypothetical protein